MSISFDERTVVRDRTGRFGPHPHTAPETLLPQVRASRDDNLFIREFEDDVPDPTPAQLLTEWDSIGVGGDVEEDPDAPGRRAAVAELSRRIADGQPGTLCEAAELKPGDLIDVSRLEADAGQARARQVAAGPHTVRRVGSCIRGLRYLEVDGLSGVQYPEGTLVPVLNR